MHTLKSRVVGHRCIELGLYPVVEVRVPPKYLDCCWCVLSSPLPCIAPKQLRATGVPDGASRSSEASSLAHSLAPVAPLSAPSPLSPPTRFWRLSSDSPDSKPHEITLHARGRPPPGSVRVTSCPCQPNRDYHVGAQRCPDPAWWCRHALDQECHKCHGARSCRSSSHRWASTMLRGRAVSACANLKVRAPQ